MHIAFGFPLSSTMKNTSELSSAFVNLPNDVTEEIDQDGLAEPKASAFVSTHLTEDPPVSTDAPLPTVSQIYVWNSYPGVLNLSLNPGVNPYHLSPMHCQKFLTGKDGATPTGQKNLNSMNSLLKASNFSLPTGQHSKKPGATTENGIHKMIEKQRRNDMKRLYSTLASLIPEANLRGKYSVLDQVQKAIDYIRHLQEKVKRLAERRDEIMIISNKNRASCFTDHREEKIPRFLPFHIGSETFPSLRVNSFGLGVEIVANTFKYQVAFSNLLQALEEEGLEIVSAAASTVNDKAFHTIYSKISNIHAFESTVLYQRLWHLIQESMQDA